MSTSSVPSIDSSRLDEQLDEEFDYTNGDVIVNTLLTIIDYHIQRETNDMIVLFNNQCYDFMDFDTHMKEEYRKGRRLEDSGYTTCLLDSQAGEEYPLQLAVNNLFHRTLSISKLQEILMRQMCGLTWNKSRIYVPTGNEDQTIIVDELVKHAGLKRNE